MLNIIIDGIPEKSDENVKMTVDDMLSDMATNFRSDELSAAYRLGSKTGGRMRPIIVKFASSAQKGNYFKNISKLQNKSKWAKVFVNDDLSPRDQNKQRELRSLATYARIQGKRAKMTGRWFPPGAPVSSTRKTDFIIISPP